MVLWFSASIGSDPLRKVGIAQLKNGDKSQLHKDPPSPVLQSTLHTSSQSGAGVVVSVSEAAATVAADTVASSTDPLRSAFSAALEPCVGSPSTPLAFSSSFRTSSCFSSSCFRSFITLILRTSCWQGLHPGRERPIWPQKLEQTKSPALAGSK